MKKMSIIYKGVCALLLSLSLIGQMSCGNTEATIPTNAESVSEVAQIYPDYRDIVIPPNIAPLNVQVKSKGDAFVGSIEGGGKQIIAATDEDGVLQFDSLEWKELINAARGKDLNVTLYAEREGKWVKFPSYKITVANEGIDRYLSYRLIEPSYELYRQMGLSTCKRFMKTIVRMIKTTTTASTAIIIKIIAQNICCSTVVRRAEVRSLLRTER